MTFSQRRRLYRLIPPLFYALTDSLPYFLLGAVLAFVLTVSTLVETFQSIDKAQLAVCSYQNMPIKPLPALLTPIFYNQQGVMQ